MLMYLDESADVEHHELFHGTLPRDGGCQVWGQCHTDTRTLGDAWYTPGHTRLLPAALPRRTTETYAQMEPYIHLLQQTIAVRCFPEPQGGAIGVVTSPPTPESMRLHKIGNCFGYYYPDVQTLLLWEAYLYSDNRGRTVAEDPNMVALWQAFERWLLGRFPAATRLVTPDHDGITTAEDYQALLTVLGYRRVSDTAYGKAL